MLRREFRKACDIVDASLELERRFVVPGGTPGVPVESELRLRLENLAEHIKGCLGTRLDGLLKSKRRVTR